jgi:hypothetical protein
MDASSEDQQTGTPALQQQPRAGKRRFWAGWLINFIIIFIVVVIVLAVLIYFKIIPPQWYALLLGVLSPAFSGIGSFVKTTLADKDFQEALRKRFTQWVAGDGEKKGGDNGKTKDMGTTSQQGITINFSSTITNTSTASPAPIIPGTNASTAAPIQPAAATQQQLPVTGVEPTSLTHIESVFFVGTPLPNPGEFYGRIDERTTLFDRTRKGYSTSIVGPRRIGKTWLISFLQFAITDEFGSHFRMGYIDATRPSCDTPAGFTACALEALGKPVPSKMRSQLDLTMLEETIKDMRTRQEIPVLCIDEFEHFGDPAIFNLHFFSQMRSLAGPGLGLCLVIASKTPLIDIVGDIGKTSGFFNIFEQLTLKPFYSEEADEFINAKGAQAGFNEQERDYLRTSVREYSPKGSQWPPLRLQIAGELLERDKKLAAAGHSGRYRPADMVYWKEFDERLEEKYRGMVKV